MNALKYIQLIDSVPSPGRHETMKTAKTWIVTINLPLRTSQLVIGKVGSAAFVSQAKGKIMGVQKVEFSAEGGEVYVTLEGERVKRAQQSNETREAFGGQIARDFDKLIYGIVG